MKLLDYNSFINQDRQKVRSVNEHLWSSIIYRSETGTRRKEDNLDLLDITDFFQYIYNNYTFDASCGPCDMNYLDDDGIILRGYLKKSKIFLMYVYNKSLTLVTGYEQIALELDFGDLKTSGLVGDSDIEIKILDKDDKCSNNLVIDVLDKLIDKYTTEFTIEHGIIDE